MSAYTVLTLSSLESEWLELDVEGPGFNRGERALRRLMSRVDSEESGLPAGLPGPPPVLYPLVGDSLRSATVGRRAEEPKSRSMIVAPLWMTGRI